MAQYALQYHTSPVSKDAHGHPLIDMVFFQRLFNTPPVS